MEIRTIEDNFDYQVEEILKSLLHDFKEDIIESGLSFQDWLWANPKELGKAFYDKIDAYQGIDETCQNIVEQ